MKNFVRSDLNFAFAVLDRIDGGNGTHESAGVPIGDIAMFEIAGEAAVPTPNAVRSKLDDLRCGCTKAAEHRG